MMMVMLVMMVAMLVVMQLVQAVFEHDSTIRGLQADDFPVISCSKSFINYQPGS